MNIDLILCWPDSADYPLFRQYLRDNRWKFNKVIIVITETNASPNFKAFIRESMFEDNIIILDNRPLLPGEDWRNVAVNEALQVSDSEWVLFSEQDFVVQDEDMFWDHVWMLSLTKQSIGVYQGGRLHPCCLFLHRNILSKITKDFSAKPPEYDHFGAIQKELKRLKILTGLIPSYTYHHMNGLSHNWRLVAEGGKPNYNPDVFNKWLVQCMQVDVPLNEQWQVIAQNYFDREQIKINTTGLTDYRTNILQDSNHSPTVKTRPE